jgi:hypothetical protein
MNNIEKMRREFEEKIQLAMLENQIETRLANEFGDREICVALVKCKDTLLLCGRNTSIWKNPTLKGVGTLMKAFPVSDKIDLTDNADYVDYKFDVSKASRMIATELQIKWKCKEGEVHVKLNVEDCPKDFLNYFRETSRDVLNDYGQRITIRYKTFAAVDNLKYAGGHEVLRSVATSNAMANYIKSL